MPTVTALVVTHNHADVVSEHVTALLEQGLQVHVIDCASTDGTVPALEAFVGRAGVSVETLSHVPTEAASREVVLRARLHRVEQLGGEPHADWVLYVEADEFPESPWPDETLARSIARVDAAGFNAIDFRAFDFVPTVLDEASDDARQRLRRFEPGPPPRHAHVRAWKRIGQPVDLTSSDGDARFARRHICPVPFMLRSYARRHQPPLAGAEASALRVFDLDIARFTVLRETRDVLDARRVTEGNEADAEAMIVTIGRLQREVEQLQERVAEREAMVQQLLTSRSWKLTAPLRAIDRLLKPPAR
jgi:hypothetical protein